MRIQAWQNEQPEYKNPNAGGGKLLRLIRPVNRLRLGNMLDELEHLTNSFPEKLINEKLLKAREDFLDAIKSNLIRRASMSLRGVKDALNFAMEFESYKRQEFYPKDLMTLTVTIKKYIVSKSTLRRALKDGRLTDYNQGKESENSPVVVSENEVKSFCTPK